MEGTNEVALINVQELQKIVSDTPTIFTEGQERVARVRTAFDQIFEQAKEGMTDEIAEKIAEYMGKANKTLIHINAQRTPVTQLFNLVRDSFTGLENSIKDYIKQGQKLRDDWETEKMRRQRLIDEENRKKKLKEEERVRMEADTEKMIKQYFSTHLATTKAHLISVLEGMTIPTEENVRNYVSNYSTILETMVLDSKDLNLFPLHLTADEMKEIRYTKMASLFPQMSKYYTDQVGAAIIETLHKIPSKVAELREIENAAAEQAEQLRKAAEERKAKEEQRIAEEARKQAEEANKAAEGSKQAGIMNLEFEEEAAVAEAAPVVKGKIEWDITVTHAQGYAELFAMWFAKEGAKTPLDKLKKMTPERCVTYFENLAEKKGEKLESKYFSYEERFKTKL